MIHTADTKGGQTLWTRDFVGIILINFLIYSGFRLILPTLPVYMKSLGGLDASIGLIPGLITFSSLIVRPLSGIALDRYGRKGVFLAGIVLVVLVTLAYSWFPSIGTILAICFLHGFGWGIICTASNTIAADIIPKEHMGEGMGFFSISTGLSLVLSPAIGLYLLSAFDFTLVTQLSAALATIALVLAFFAHYHYTVKKERIHKKIEAYEKSCIRPSIVMFFIATTYGAASCFIALYGIERGIDNIGVFFMIYAVAMIASRPLFGKIIDRFGYDHAMYPGLIILTVAMFLISKADTLPMFLIASFSYGIGLGAVVSSLHTLAINLAPQERLGATNATFYTGFDGGIGVGSIVAGIVASAWGYSQMFLSFIIFLVVAFVLYILLLGKTSSKA